MHQAAYIERAIYALTHFGSQLLYRWLPPPAVSYFDLELLMAACGFGVCGSVQDLAALSVDDWAAILRWDASEGGALFPWLPNYVRLRQDAGGRRLAGFVWEHFDAARRAGANVVAYCDSHYPKLLREIPDPPLAFTVLGDPALLQRDAVSVVGSRKASALALRESFALGRVLAESGRVVVSGGAFGCDIAAHQGVLATGIRPAPAVVVFAGGLESLYPKRNERIFNELKLRGAVLLSERFWTANCRPLDFAARNRIISGLAGSTVVMQAARKSGAILTARLALDQGRELEVLAHPPGDVRASGGALLLSEGAREFSAAHAWPSL